MLIIISILVLCSFLLSLRSLRSELKKNIKTHEVAASLAKGRVLFIADSSKSKTQEHHVQQVQPVQAQTPPTSQETISVSPPPHEQSLSDVRDKLSQLQNPSSEQQIQKGE